MTEHSDNFEFDVFISHATEDKENFVRPLAELLAKKKITVWYDEFTLDIGDSLRESIDKGLSKSRYGIVVLSQSFFAKQWTQYELNGLVTRQNSNGDKIIIPIWHEISKEEVVEFSPSLGDLVALNSQLDIEYICERITRKIKKYSLKTEPSVEEVSAKEELIELIEKEETEQEAKNKKILLNLLEKYLVEEKYRIELFKLLQGEADNLSSKLRSNFSDLVSKEPMPELIKEKMEIYDLLCDNLLELFVNGCYWTNNIAQYPVWVKALQKIANSKAIDSGYVHLINLQYYPSLLLMYASGMAAIANQNWELLKSLWLNTTLYGHGNSDKKTILERVYPNKVIDRDVINQAFNKRYWTPVSDHLFEVIRPYFSKLIPEDPEYHDLFNMYEYLQGLQFGTIRITQGKPFWAPTGRFKWSVDEDDLENAPAAKVSSYIQTERENWGAIKAGLFGGNMESLTKVKQDYDHILKSINWF